jgi:Gpi18-like mannosyltransferase
MSSQLPCRASRATVTSLLILLALLLARLTWGLAGVDLHYSYLPWFEHIRERGPIAAFAAPFGSYMPPYLYMLAAATPLAPLLGSFAAVKLVSYVGHLLLAAAVRHLLVVLGQSHPTHGAALVALAPSLFISPALLTQCDAYWAAPLVMALAAAMTRRHAAMLLWCGVAFGVKLQAGFAVPLFFAITLARSLPLRVWLMAPLGFLATLLPAWLAGWPAADLLTIYLRQVEFTNRLSLDAPNIWMIVELLLPPLPSAFGIIATIVATIASAVYVRFFVGSLKNASAGELLDAACLCALLVPGFLPRMHERYFFLADVLTLVLAISRSDRWRVAALVQFGSTTAITAYIIGVPDLAVLGALTMIGATWLVARGCGPSLQRSQMPNLVLPRVVTASMSSAR